MKKVLLVFLILLLSACTLGNEVDEIFIQNYLNNKYGEDIVFTPVYTSSCKIYELGKCRSTFTSSDLENKEIQIFWTKEDGSDLKDDYLFKKYESNLKDYYNNLLSSSMNGNYKLEVMANKSDYNWDKNLSFEEFLKYENLNLAISINIANSSEDINLLGERIKSVLKQNNVSNVASLYLTSYNDECSLDNVSSCTKVNSIYVEVKIVEFYDENSKKY